MARVRMTFENRIDRARERIRENPRKALSEIGKILVAEVKRAVPVNSGKLKRSIGYWVRRREGNLQIGSKSFYAAWVEKGTRYSAPHPFLLITIERCKDKIQELIKQALRELGR